MNIIDLMHIGFFSHLPLELRVFDNRNLNFRAVNFHWRTLNFPFSDVPRRLFVPILHVNQQQNSTIKSCPNFLFPHNNIDIFLFINERKQIKLTSYTNSINGLSFHAFHLVHSITEILSIRSVPYNNLYSISITKNHPIYVHFRENAQFPFKFLTFSHSLVDVVHCVLPIGR